MFGFCVAGRLPCAKRADIDWFSLNIYRLEVAEEQVVNNRRRLNVAWLLSLMVLFLVFINIGGGGFVPASPKLTVASIQSSSSLSRSNHMRITGCRVYLRECKFKDVVHSVFRSTESCDPNISNLQLLFLQCPRRGESFFLRRAGESRQRVRSFS